MSDEVVYRGQAGRGRKLEGTSLNDDIWMEI